MSLSLILSTVANFALALTIHEYAHAWTAVRLGDSTPKWQGRLTFDPRAHLSLLGTLMIFLAGIGWAKPVQVNPRNLRNPRSDMLLIALAGPLSNLSLALLFSVLYRIVVPLMPFSMTTLWIMDFLSMAVFINILLFLFNLIPIPPLDGSKILARLLSGRWQYQLMQLEQYGVLILVLGLAVLNLGSRISSLTSLLVTRLLWS